MRSPVATTVESPYVGLAPFDERYAPYFFGRDRERRVVIANLLTARLTLLYGQSGVGKSSLLAAGVLYHLQRDPDLHQQGQPPLIVRFGRWAVDPLAGLTRALADTAPDADVVPDSGPGALSSAISAVAATTDADLLFILDQFEEFFVYHRNDGAATKLARELGRILRDPQTRANFLIAMREDALAELDALKGPVPALFENRIRLDPLDEQAAREAIVRPPRRFAEETGIDVAVEDRLVSAVIEDVALGRVVLGETGRGLSAGALPTGIDAPYLQLVLERVWAADAEQGRLTLRTYRQLGRAEAIVRAHLDEALGQLDLEERRTAAAIFDRLVTPSGSKIAHLVSDLATYADVTDEAVLAVVKKLAGEQRILRGVATPGAAPTEQRYEIYHDALGPAILDWRSRFLQDVHEREIVQEAQTRPDVVSFPELVWAHWEYERELRAEGRVSTAAELRYRETLAVFERREGEIVNAYWAVTVPAAVAVTERRPLVRQRLLGATPNYRLHRVSEHTYPALADVLNECDVLATRSTEVLRGTTQRIAIGLVFAIASRAIAELEGPERDSPHARLEGDLTRAQHYYRGGAERTLRLRYFFGMLASLFVIACLAALVYLIAPDYIGFASFTTRHEFTGAIVAAVAGAVGGVVSAIVRMGAVAAEFSADLSRREMRLMATSRPVMGAVFGLVAFLALTSVFTVTSVEFAHPRADHYLLATAAFAAGFLERAARIVLSPALALQEAAEPWEPERPAGRP